MYAYALSKTFAVLGVAIPFTARAERALRLAGVAGAARDALLSSLFFADRFILGSQLPPAAEP